MSDHLDRIIDIKKRSPTFDDAGEGVTSLERISVYLELINHAESRAQALAGMAGTALGVFFAAFIAAFVTDVGRSSPALKTADLISEVLFVVGAFLLLACIFQSLRPMNIEDPWDEAELRVHWQGVDRLHDTAARYFWVGAIILAVSIGILIAADVLIDVGFFGPVPGQ